MTGWRIEGAAKDLVGEDGMGLEDRRSRGDARASNVAETAGGGGGGKGHG